MSWGHKAKRVDKSEQQSRLLRQSGSVGEERYPVHDKTSFIDNDSHEWIAF